MKHSTIWWILGALILAGGCARTERVKAVEGDKSLAYESLGTLEIKEKAYALNPSNAFWTSVEVATLSFARTPSRGEHYKRLLRKKLAKVADSKYDADAVINVHYWPDPESKKFPDGYVYARGEMIRYHSFPGDAPQPAPPAAQA